MSLLLGKCSSCPCEKFDHVRFDSENCSCCGHSKFEHEAILSVPAPEPPSALKFSEQSVPSPIEAGEKRTSFFVSNSEREALKSQPAGTMLLKPNGRHLNAKRSFSSHDCQQWWYISFLFGSSCKSLIPCLSFCLFLTFLRDHRQSRNPMFVSLSPFSLFLFFVLCRRSRSDRWNSRLHPLTDQSQLTSLWCLARLTKVYSLSLSLWSLNHCLSSFSGPLPNIPQKIHPSRVEDLWSRKFLTLSGVMLTSSTPWSKCVDKPNYFRHFLLVKPKTDPFLLLARTFSSSSKPQVFWTHQRAELSLVMHKSFTPSIKNSYPIWRHVCPLCPPTMELPLFVTSLSRSYGTAHLLLLTFQCHLLLGSLSFLSHLCGHPFLLFRFPTWGCIHSM